MRAILACLAFALPCAAFAECPSAKSDLDKGIHLTSDGPQSIRYRRDAQGHVLVESFPLGDYAFSYLATTMFGLYPLQEGTAYLGETMPDSLASMTYAVPSGNLPEPSPGLAFHSPVRTGGAEGVEPVMFVTVGPAVTKSYGDCRFETLPVTARIAGPDDDDLARFDYIPALGLAVEWLHGSFAAVPEVKTNLRLSLTPPDGMPP
ncbi:MAG: hypothetical protein WBA92_07800 [Pseudorhodobacter sp.]